MSEPGFMLSEGEKSQAAALILERGARMLRDGFTIKAASDAVSQLGERWLVDWEFKQTLLGMNHSLGAVAVRAFDSNSEASEEVIPSTPPVYGGEEFSPDQLENEGVLDTNMLGYLIPILGQVIDADFAPASVIKGARDSIASLRAITRGESKNEYGILSTAIKQATGAAPFGWRQSDLDQAGALLTEMVRLQLGGRDEEPRDLSGKSYLELTGRTNDNVFSRHNGTPKVPAESGSLVARGVGSREPRIRTILVKNGPRGKRGTVGIREAVRNTLGIKTSEKYHELQVLIQ